MVNVLVNVRHVLLDYQPPSLAHSLAFSLCFPHFPLLTSLCVLVCMFVRPCMCVCVCENTLGCVYAGMSVSYVNVGD